MKSLTVTLLTFLTSFAFAQDSLIVKALQDNTYSFGIENGAFTGTGTSILEEAIANSQFLPVGEQHGIREIGEFTKVLFEQASKKGFKYMAIETDPFTATKVEELANGTVDEAKAHLQKFPLTIPFYDNNEDFEFLKGVVTNSDADPTFWGLDQTFVAGTRYLFSQLMELASTDEEQNVAAEYFKKANEAFGEAMQDMNPNKIYLVRMEEADFEKLSETFCGNGEDIACQIVQEIRKSKEIYQYWYDGKYLENNSVRSELMKRHFMDYYRNAQKAGDELPKVVFKFGANHCVRGLTYVHIFDLGNLISELAAMNGTSSFHVLFTGAKGTTHNQLQGTQPFDATEGWHENVKAALGDRLDTEDWLLVDMRPIRKIRMKKASDDFKRLVFGWDVWIIVPEAHAVTGF